MSRPEAKIRRNDPCFCGSGIKYKKCHGRPDMSSTGNDDNRNFSRLEDHHRQGKSLVPPLLQVPKLQPTSWMNDRLPEMLWAALLVTQLPREAALNLFRAAATYIHSVPEDRKFHEVTHSGLAKVDTSRLQEFLDVITSDSGATIALTPLLLLDQLPAREAWSHVLHSAPKKLGWEALMAAVSRTLFHQSEEATDCRWLRVLVKCAAGKIFLSTEMGGTANEIIGYPKVGDLREVRPSIRALEGTLSAASAEADWPAIFWQECMIATPCFPLKSDEVSSNIAPATTGEAINSVRRELISHAYRTRVTTDVDARHDTSFGIALYCLAILEDLLRPGAAMSITGRLALRTLAESYITFAYLISKDSVDLWKTYRVFGAGQAKLAFLRLYAADQRPSGVDLETLERLANEDVWQEFVRIDLGHWEKSDLRKMSEEAGVKDVYDRFYGWTSTFSHGHWCAVRDCVFDTCGNPLHRLHRILRDQTRRLPDVISDACDLTDRTLELIAKAYPVFS